jgi:hypothetical protein
VGVGSYEPGEGWERVGVMVEWIVSVFDLMERKGGRRCSRNLKLGDGDCRLGPLGRRKRRPHGEGMQTRQGQAAGGTGRRDGGA